MPVVRILRDSRRWYYVRLSCPCGCSRTSSGATLAAAVANFRFDRFVKTVSEGVALSRRSERTPA